MAPTGKWPARIALALSAAVLASLFTVMNASGQQAGEVLTVGKDVESGSITQVTYSIVVRNQGTANSTGVVVRDNVPANTTFESSQPPPSATTSPAAGAPSCDNAGTREGPGTTCQWDLGTIPPGEMRTITATYNLNQGDIPTYTVTNNVSVRDGQGHEDTDSDASLTRARVAISDDTWVDDAEPANTNHGACTDLRVLQGNRITSFVETDSLPANDTIDRLFGAQLRMQVLTTSYTQSAPGVIGVHRITSGEWSQGGGSCQGGQGTGDQSRTGLEPASAGVPTGTAEVNQFPQDVNWNVTADLDTDEDRGTFNGWELRDQATSGADNFTRFHSTESSDPAQDPKLFLVYAIPEAPTASGSPSATAGTTSSPSPTPSLTPSPTPTSPQSSRTISLFAEPNRVVYPGEVVLSGQITSPDSSCEDAGEFVRIQRRILGQSEYTDFESDVTDADGRFEVTFASTQSAEYVAVAPRHEQCADASSSPETLTVKVKITGRAGRSSVERGSSVGIVGRVKPDHDGTTVLLQRRKGDRWVTVARDELNARSRYRFVLDANWRGRRTFRVLWRAQDDEHAANNSRNVVVRATRG